MFFKKIRNQFQKVKAKVRQKLSNIFVFHFVSFFILSFVLLSVASYFTYTSTKEAEERNFSESALRSQKLIVRLVESYNAHMSSLYKNFNRKQLDTLLEKLSKVQVSDSGRPDAKHLTMLARLEGLRIELVNFQTSEIVWSTKSNTPNKYHEKIFPEIKYIYKKLSEGKRHVRFTRISELRKLKIFVRDLSSNKKFLWRIIYPAVKDRELENLIDFLKNTSKYEPFVEKTGMYSIYGHMRHGIEGVKLPKVMHESIYKPVCSRITNCTLWKKNTS